MGKRKQVLIPYHFGTELSLIPNRIGDWDVIDAGTIATKLFAAKMLNPDILVSGDCMGAIAAQRDDLTLVWMDAHADFHSLLTTSTGALGGMPLAMLCGIGDQSLMEACETKIPTRVVHISASRVGFDNHELDRMLAVGVSVVNWLGTPKERIHLHIDMDVISSTELPSNFHPSSSGMLLDQFWKQFDTLLPTVEVLSIKTYDPRLDASQIGESICLEMIRRFSNG